MKPLLVILDAGHGGIVDGRYTTAPKKMFQYGNGEIAYEGVINRNVKEKLMQLLLREGIAFEDVSHGNYDTPLTARVALANHYNDKYSETHRLLYLSLHSNAGQGTGFEVWTSKGETLSDKYASMWIEELKNTFPEFPIRSDFSDGDPDKESDFYVLKNTVMPAVLGELLFFDNYNDYKVIRHPEYLERVSKATLNFLKRVNKEIL